MNSLSFIFRPSVESNDHEVRVLIDGVDVLERIDKSVLGLDPTDFFCQSALAGAGELLIGRCSCGCLGCGDEGVTVVYDSETISWLSRHPWISGAVFAKPAYLDALARARAETSWETTERTAERLVGQLDFSEFQKRGMVFRWASGRIDREKIVLSFEKAGAQELVYLDWNHCIPADAEQAARRFIESHTFGD